MSVLSKEEASEFCQSIRGSLKIMNDIGFADMNIQPPDINFYEGSDQFFNPEKHEIHIGIYGILELFHPETEDEFLSALNYVRGHEEQHCRSTASKPYRIAIQKGCETILEYIQFQEDGYRRRFRKDSDYLDFLNNLPSRKIYVSREMIQPIVAGIANSVEDGRIERIRSIRFPGFGELRRIYRGIFWDHDDEFKPYSEIRDNSAEKLRILMNQILTLATCQLYEKNFLRVYAGTPLVNETNRLMQPIGKAVLGNKTRDLINPVGEICQILAPYIYETCRISAKDIEARKVLEQIIRKMIESMIEQGLGNSELTEQNEDIEEQVGSSLFDHSDLVITLDDDTYDKLEKESRLSSNKQSGIMVRREHPKEENQKQKSNDAVEHGYSNSSKEKGEKERDTGNTDSNETKKEKESQDEQASSSSKAPHSDASDSNTEAYAEEEPASSKEGKTKASDKKGY